MHLPGANELPPVEGTVYLAATRNGEVKGKINAISIFFTTLHSLPPASHIVYPHLSFAVRQHQSQSTVESWTLKPYSNLNSL
ncbi:uncharacterized protein N7496_011893 [Penicillium cataractarum]|uniref:Uncharacterized protein n=1 Tax=Penicillium cataractarum TaxID=2100454 RepID=A0A9W9RFZ1_9EURO|nr:uncharacterized protein N7496_011893 [Penicillium cataractarum]KAJ5359480.1 hypothetical protein N7496_011893 [Penicillium cataractarum]